MNSYLIKHLFAFSIILLSLSTNLFGQTTELPDQCGDGTDNDGDGLVDCYDGDCAENADCSDFFFGNVVSCSDEVEVNSFAIREQWGSEESSATSHATPIIGDLDGNGIPEVVAANNRGRTVYIINGATGATITSASLPFAPENAPIIGNIDDDETSEILVTQDKGDDMIMYDFDGDNLTIKWARKASRNQAIGLPGFADFDEDGNVEIYYRNEIVDARTGDVLVQGSSSGQWDIDLTHGSLAVDILDDTECADCAGLELISGNEVWAINVAAGTRTLVKDMDDDLHDDIDPNRNYYPKYYPNWDDQWSAVSAADYNLDGHIDILTSGALGTSGETYTGQTTVFFWDVFNGEVLIYDDPTSNFVRGTGRINIGDMDGDGAMNASFVMDQKLIALDENFDIHWIHPIKEGSSGFTGCALFDFNGDGEVEVVYRSEKSIVIIDGAGNGDNTTFERNEIACVSRTQEEYPVVADVDGDGSSEICVSCYFNNNTPFKPYSNTEFSQIRAFESDGEAWMPARGVWNQHAYYNVNVNDDLTIPREVQDHSIVFSSGECSYVDGTTIPFPSRPLNSFLNQAPVLDENGCVEFVSPDIIFKGILSTTDAECPDAEVTVEFVIANSDSASTAISGGLPVSYYAGDPRLPGFQLLDTEIVLLQDLDIGEELIVTQTISALGGEFELFVVINDNGNSTTTPYTAGNLPTSTIPECDTDNNIQSADVGFTEFALSIEKLSDNQICNGATVPNNGSARAFYFGEIPGSNESIWIENFEDNAINASSDTDETAWTSFAENFARSFRVRSYRGSQMFRVERAGGDNNQDLVVWTSEEIDISQHEDISISVDMFESGQHESSGRYQDFAGVYYSLDGGSTYTVLENGFHKGNFDYQNAFAEEIRPDINDPVVTTLIIKAEFHTSGNNEVHYIDNIRVEGTSTTVQAENTEPEGFAFFWYRQGDFSAEVHEGSTYAQMDDGVYDVVGFYAPTGCYSDTVQVTIDLIEAPSHNVWIYEVSALDNCENPNGSLGAFVYTRAVDENLPVSETNPAADTLTTGDGYQFTWRLTDDPSNTTVGTGDIIGGLSNQLFTVDVTESSTGCVQSEDLEVSSGLSFPADPTVVVTNISTCGGSGTLSANVGGNTADYTFEWFDGEGIKPTADFNGAEYTVSEPTSYTVRATQISSGCTSNAVTVTMGDDSSAPNAIASQIDANTFCGTSFNGSAQVEVNGSVGTSGFAYTWYVGVNTIPENEIPSTSFSSAAFGAGEWEMTGLNGDNTYTIVVENTATNCTDTTTVDIANAFVEPEFVLNNEINTGNAIEFEGRSIVTLPQLFGPGNAIEQELTVSYWADLRTQNYAEDHRVFSSGSTGEGQVLLWSDNHNGLAFVVGLDGGGRGRINSAYSASGWTHVTGTWNGVTGDMNLYANGVLIGQSNQPGTVIDAGANMFIGADNNRNTKKFEGRLDELRIYNKALTSTEINEQMCRELTGAEDGLIAYYNFNTVAGVNVADGATIVDQAGNNDGTIDLSTGSVSVETADIECPIADAVANTSCDTPNGSIDLSGFVTPSTADATYTFRLYDGFSTDVLITSNANGLFEGLSGGFYTLTAQDDNSECITSPVTVSLADIPDLPTIIANKTDNSFCENGNGVITITTSSNNVEPSNYLYEIFDGFTTASAQELTAISNINVADGSIGHSFTDLETGNYRIRVTNSDLGCMSFTDVTIADISTISSFESNPTIVDNTSCSSPGIGFVVVRIDGENESDFDFAWYDGENTSATLLSETSNRLTGLEGTAAGRPYTVVAKNKASGCETAPLTVEVYNDPFTPDVVLVQEEANTSCGEGNGSLRAYATNDPDLPSCSECVTNYSFEWFLDGNLISAGDDLGNNSNVSFSGTNNSVIEGLSDDLNQYSVVMTHSTLGCDGSETIILSENKVFPILSLTSSTANTACDVNQKDGSITVSATPADTYDFDWFDNNKVLLTDIAPIKNSSAATINGLAAGTYFVVATGTNSCTSDTLSVSVIDELNNPDFEVATLGAGTVNNTVCNETLATSSFNGQITVNPTAASGDAVGDFTYVWYDGVGTGSPTAFTATNNVLSDAPGGTYTVEITRTGNGCPTTLQATITDETNDDFTTFDLDTHATANDVTSCNTDNGSIVLDVTNLDAAPVNGSGNYNFRLFNGTSVDATPDLEDNTAPYEFSGLAVGDYTVEVIDLSSGCATLPITLNIGETPNNPDFEVATLGAGTVNNTVCNETLATSSFNGQITVNPTAASGDAVGDFTYVWYDGVGTGSPTAFTATNNVLSDAPGGTYTVEITRTGNGCPTTLQATITDETNDDFATFDLDTHATANDVTSCNTDNGSIVLDVTNLDAAPVNGSGNYNFRLFNGTSVDATPDLEDNTAPYEFSGLAVGDYTVEVIDLSSGCATLPITLNIGETPNNPDFEVATLGAGTVNNTVCNETLATSSFNGQITVNPTAASGDAVGDFTYVWYDGVGTGSPTAFTATNNVLSDAPGGTYTVEITRTGNGCPTTLQATITDETNDDFATFDLDTHATANDVTSCNTDNGSIVLDVTNLDAAPVNGSGNYNFRLFNGTSVDATPDLEDNTAPYEFSGLAVGDYTVEVIDLSSGCATLPITLNIGETPNNPDFEVATLGAGTVNNTVCNETLATSSFNGQITVNPTAASGDAVGDFTYVWYDGVGTGSPTAFTATNNVLSDAPGGTYTVEITRTGNGCPTTLQATITDETNDDFTTFDLDTHATANDVTSCNTDNGSIVLDVTNLDAAPVNGSGNYNFRLFNGTSVDATPDLEDNTAPYEFSGLAVGDYTVEVIDLSSGCATLPITLNIGETPNNPDFEVATLGAGTVNNTVCNETLATSSFNGQITVNPTAASGDAVGDFTYVWYDGVGTGSPTAFTATNNVLSDAPGGTYTVEITRTGNGCPTTLQATITDETNDDFATFDLDTHATANDVTSCNTDNGSIVLDVTNLDAAPVNGSGNYNFRLFNGTSVDATPDLEDNTAPYEFSGLAVGDYTVEVIDLSSGCATLPITLNIGETPNNPDFEVATLGAGTVNNTVCNETLATSSFNGQITVNPTAASGDAVGDFTYVWYDGVGTGSPTAFTATNNVLSDAPGGTYTVEITRTGNGCPTTLQATITDETNDDFTTFDLDTHATANDVTSCNTDNGSIVLDVTNLDAAPVNGSGNYNFRLFNGTSVDATPDLEDNTAPYEFSGLAVGDYTVEVIDLSSGCATLPITLNIGETPNNPDFEVATLGAGTVNNTVCNETLATSSFNGQITVNPTAASGDAVGDFTYVWYDGVGTGSPTAFTATNNVLSDAPGGTYTVEITRTGNGCPTTLQATITDETNDDFTTFDLDTHATANDVTSCNTDNGSIVLDVTNLDAAPVNGSGNYNFRLFNGTSVDATPDLEDNTAPYEFSGLAVGDYTVEVIDLSSGCATLPITLNIGETPNNPDFEVATLGAGTVNNTVCNETLATSSFNGQITVNPTAASGDAVGDFTYVWYDGVGTGSPTAFTATNNVLSDAPGGTYTVEITRTGNGCPTTLQATITDETNDDFATFDLDTHATANDVTSCNTDNGSIVLDVTNLDAAPVNGSGNYNFRLFNGTSVDATPDLEDNTAPYEFSGLAVGDYTVEVIDLSSGCATLPITLNIGETPNNPDFEVATLGAGTVNNTVCNETLATSSFNGQITVNPTAASGDAVGDFTYVWYDGVGTGSPTAFTATNNVLSDAPGGTYTVEITRTGNGCPTTLQATITDDFTDLPIVADLTGASSKTDLTVCEDNSLWPNATISASVTGGSNSYTYNWYFGSSVDAGRLIANGDNIATRKGTGSSNAVVAGAETQNISNLDPGFYTLQVLDTERGCLSSIQTFEIIDATVSPDFSAQVNTNNFACSGGTATGEVTVSQNDTGGTYLFEWYEGGSAIGVADYTTQTVSNLTDGTYTVKVTNTATSCFYLETVTVEEIIPTLTIGTSSSDQTNCAPNGTATATPSVNFNPGGNPSGYTADFVYEWYLGNTTTTTLANNTDPGNGSNPTGVGTSTVSGLAAGNYTVVVTDNGSSCVATQQTVTVVDAISTLSPTFNISGDPSDGAPRNIPSDCGEQSGYIIALITPNGGASYTYQWFEGSDDYTGSTMASPIANGVATNQGATNPQILNTSATEIRLTNITSGIYTLVATDASTGCKYQETYDLGFIGQQTTTTIAIQNVEECPDDGQASVGIQDNPSNGLGTFAGEDDINNYDIYLFAGNGVPAEIFSNDAFQYTVNNDDGSTSTYPIIRDGSTVSPGEQVDFSSLPPGTYTAIAKQKVSFNALGCWSESAVDEIEDRAYEPILGAITTVDNTICDVVVAGNYNGEATIGGIKNADDTKQPGNFNFDWSGPNGFSASEVNVASSNQTQLEPGDYTITISRSIPTFDITYTSGGSFTDGEDLNFSNGTSGVILSNSGAILNVYMLNGDDPSGSASVDGESSSITGNISSIAAGSNYVNGCSISEVITIEDNSVNESIFGSLDVTNVQNCDPDNTGIITVLDANVTSGAIADYQFAFYPTLADAQAETNALQALSASPTYNAPAPANGNYYIVAVNQNTGCKTEAFEATIGVDTEEPIVLITGSSADTSCDADANEGNGTITFSIDNAELNSNYSYQWYAGSNTSGTALTNTAPITNAAGILNGANAAAYQLTLSGIDAGTYTLEVIDTDPNNNNCAALATFTINDESIQPTIVVADNVTLEDNDNCSPSDGFIQINSVKEGTNDIVVNPANYSFTWFKDGIAFNDGVDGNIVSAGGSDNRIQNLSEGTYSVEITNTTTFCQTVGRAEIIIYDIQVDPIIAVTAKTADTQCTDADNNGNGSATIAITEDDGTAVNLANNDYSITWYRGTYNTEPTGAVATDNIIANQATADNANEASANAGTALVNGNILSLDGLENGTYTVFINKIADNSANGNQGCEAFTTITIDSDPDEFSVDVASANVTVVDNDNCSPADGSITINSININGAVFTLDNSTTDYAIAWSAIGAGTVGTSAGGLTDNQLTGVDAGTYSFTVSNTVTGCVTATVDVVVDDIQVDPIIAVTAKTADTQCTDADNNGNGSATIAITEDDGTAVNLANNDYSITWYRGTYNTEPTGAVATDNIIANQATADNANEASANAGTALVNGNILSLDGLENGTYTVFINKIADNSANGNQGCEAFTTITIDSDPDEFSVDVASANVTVVDNDNCSPADGSITINSININGAVFTLDNSTTDYAIAWSAIGAGTVGTSAGGLTDNQLTGVDAGTYSFTVSNTVTGCVTATVDVVVDDIQVDPIIAVTAKTADTQCTDADNNGNGSATIAITEDDGTAVNLANNDYSITWYRGTYNTEPTGAVATDNIIANQATADNANEASANAGTALVNGNILSLDGLENGTYTVFINKIADNSANGNQGCEAFTTITIDSDPDEFSVDVASANVTVVDNDNCSPADGSITINSININGAVFTLDNSTTDYAIAWSAIGAGTVGTSAGGLTDNQLTGVDAGTYSFTVSNTVTGCVTATVDVVVDDIQVDPIIAVTAKTADTQCTDADNNGNGSATIAITEDDGTAVNLANNDYSITWYRGTYNTEPTGAVATDNIIANQATADNANEASANAGTALVNGNILSLDGLENGTYTVFINKIADNSANGNQGCEAFTTITIDSDPDEFSVDVASANVTVVDNDNCSPADGSITINSININGAVFTLDNSTTDYAIAWSAIGAGTVGTSAGGLTDNQLTGVDAGTYSFTVSNTVTGCVTATVDVVVDDIQVDPIIAVTAKTADTQCTDADNNGNGSATIAITEDDGTAVNLANNDYSITWYRGTYNTEPTGAVATDNIIANQATADNANEASANAGTALVNGNILSLDGLENGTYTVFINKIADNSANGNQGCEAFTTITIDSDPDEFSVDVASANVTVVDNDNCSPADGSITINSININGAVFTLDNSTTDYAIAWSAIGAGTVGTSAGGLTDNQLTGVDAGTYSFTVSNTVTGCVTATVDVVVDDIQVDPIIAVTAKTADTQCTDADNNGNGSATIAITEDDGTAVNLANNDYSITWYRGTYNTEPTGAVATDNIIANQATADNANEASANAGTALVNGNILSLDGLENGTYTVFINKIADNSANGNQGCEAFTTITIDSDPDEFSVDVASANVTVVDNDNCSPADGSITINSININGAVFTLDNSTTDYAIAWSAIGAGTVGTSAGGLTDNQLTGVDAGTYSFTVSNTVTGCVTATVDVVVDDIQVDPIIAVTAKTADTQCTDADNNGNGSATIAITEDDGTAVNLANNDYSITWYRGTYNTEPTGAVATDNIIANQATADNANEASANAGTALVNGNILSLDGLENGTYTVFINKIADNSANGNQGCEAFTTITIDSDPDEFSVDVASANVTVVDNDNCSPADGSITINSININGAVFTLDNSTTDYAIAWSAIGAGTVGTSAGGLTDNQLTGVDAGTYSFTVSNTVTGCVTATVDVVVDDIQVDPIIAVTAKTADTQCTDADNNGNGSATIAITEDDGTAVNLANNDYSITWYRGTYNTEPTGAVATDNIIANQATADNANEASANAGTALVNGNILSLDGLENGTYTVFINKIADNSANGNQGCEAFTTITIDSDPDEFSVDVASANVTVVDNDNCSPADGSITINSININGAVFTLDNSTTDYAIAWSAIGAGTVGTSAGGLTDNQLTGVDAGTYSFTVSNTVTGCVTATVDVVVDDIQVDPIIAISSTTEDTYCDNSGFNGDGSLSINITEENNAAVTTDYTITWYRGDDVLAANEIFPTDNGERGSATIDAASTTLSNLASGNYTVSIVKDNGDTDNLGNEGCSTVARFTVGSMDDIPVLDVSAIQARTEADSICTGTPSGSLIITDSDIDGLLNDYQIEVRVGSETGTQVGGSPYTAGTGSPSITIDNLEGGFDYYISATNSITGCSAATAVINVKDSTRNPQIGLVEITPNANCGGTVSVGGAEVIVNGKYNSGNQSFLTFQWVSEATGNNVSTDFPGVNDTEATLSGVSEGNYTVTILNTNTNCSSEATFTVPNEKLKPVITNTEINNVTYCVDNGSFVLLQASFDGNVIDSVDLSPDYRLEVYDNDALTGTAINDGNALDFIQNNLGANTYFAVLRRVDSNCASDAFAFNIEENLFLPEVTMTVVKADSICSSGVTPTGELAALANGEASTNADYTFTWYLGSNTSGTQLQDGVALANGSVPSGSGTSTVSGLAADTYTVEVLQATSQCSSTAQIIVPSVQAEVRISDVAVTPATDCVGDGTIDVTAVRKDDQPDDLANYRFEFYTEVPTATSAVVFTVPDDGAIFDSALPGTYYIIGTNTIVNCETPVYQVEVGENFNYPNVQLSDFESQINCDPSNPNGTLTVTADGNVPTAPDYIVQWYFGTDTSNPLDESDIGNNGTLAGANDATVSGLPAGTYTVEVTYQGGNAGTGCASTETYTIEDNIPNPVDISTSTSRNTNCVNPNGQAAASVITLAPGRTISDYTFYWFNQDPGTNVDVATADFVGSLYEDIAGGTYYVYVVDNLDSFCQSVATPVTVDEEIKLPEFEVESQNVTVCFDVKNGFASVTVDDPSSVTIDWRDEANQNIGTNFFVDSLAAGNYTVSLTDVITGCVATKSISITNDAVIPNAPFITINQGRTNCLVANGSAIANVDGSTSNFLFEWFDPADMTTPYAVGSSVNNLDDITYLVKATNISTGCESSLTSVKIDNEIIEPNFEVSVTQATCLRTEDGATNQFTGQAFVAFDEFNLGSNYVWTFLQTNEVVGDDQVLIDAFPGDYRVDFRADNGCDYSATFTITTTLTVYNGVSANGDGRNDFFIVDCIDYFDNNNVQIFNRAGQRVFEVDNYNNNRSELRFEGLSNVGGGDLVLPSGTYFYIIDLQNGEDPVQGYLELVR